MVQYCTVRYCLHLSLLSLYLWHIHTCTHTRACTHFSAVGVHDTFHSVYYNKNEQSSIKISKFFNMFHITSTAANFNHILQQKIQQHHRSTKIVKVTVCLMCDVTSAGEHFGRANTRNLCFSKHRLCVCSCLTRVSGQGKCSHWLTMTKHTHIQEHIVTCHKQNTLSSHVTSVSCSEEAVNVYPTLIVY